VRRLFLSVIPRRAKKRQIVEMLASDCAAKRMALETPT
jgi:hypothetical protein